MNRQLAPAVVEPPDQPAAQPLENPIQARESLATPKSLAGISAEGASASASSSAGSGFTGPAENAEAEIRLRLGPILSDFPLGLEQPSIRDLSETNAEIVLPLEVIRSQLPQGRVVISAAMFRGALPNDLKPYFEANAGTPPQRFLFRCEKSLCVFRQRLSSSGKIKRSIIQNHQSKPLSADRKRRMRNGLAGTRQRHPDLARCRISKRRLYQMRLPHRVSLPAYSVRDEDKQDVSSPLSPLRSEIPVKVDSERLHAIFMTDETLDLAKTIRMVGELPGLRACLLNTTQGLKLAGSLNDPSREQAILQP